MSGELPVQNDKLRICFFYMFLLAVVFLTTPGVSGQTGFLGDIPAAPYNIAYDAYFCNYPEIRSCIMTASLKLGNDTHDKRHDSATYMGCIIPSNAVKPHALMLLSVAEAARASTGGCDGNTTSLENVLRGLKFSKAVSTSGIGLVLSTQDDNTTVETRCDMTCFLAAVQSYNLIKRNKSLGAIPNITAVVFSDNVRRYWFSGDRRSGEELGLPREVRSSYNFVVLYLPSAAGDGWAKLFRAAAFNRARWSTRQVYPQSVLETRNGMALAGPTQTTRPQQQERSCVEDASPLCAPLGGWTVWTGTADTRWRWDAASSAFVKTTKKGAVALLVASTTVSLLHGATPGADCPASAVVATLSVLEALKRLGCGGRDVYAFFFPGEHVGSIGSARFISDATLLECASAGFSNCTALAYKNNLNFTTVDFSAIDTFIVLDQVAHHEAPLYYHVDSRVKLGAAQERAKKVMESNGVHRAATSTLPYSPITTLIDLLPNVSVGDKVFFTLTRYNTTYVDKNVFTVFDSAVENLALSEAAVAEAADVILQVLLAANVLSQSVPLFYSSSAKVDRAVVKKLWECFTVNLHCDFLSASMNVSKNNDNTASNPVIVDDVVTPDFAVGPMTGAYTTKTQQAIEISLQRLGWKNTLWSPAVPKSLQIPRGDWNISWQHDDTWIRQHGGGRYALHVMSLWEENIGARSTMVESSIASLEFFFVSVLLAVLSVITTWMCLKY